MDALRADKPENPRRLNSCPQKRGTKSSTDLASRIVEKPSDFWGICGVNMRDIFLHVFRQFIRLLT